MSRSSSLFGALIDLLVASLRPGKRGEAKASRRGSARPTATLKSGGAQSGAGSRATVRSDGFAESPGHFGPGATRELSKAEIRALRPSYAPSLDGEPDPGEVIWTWVPYVENDGRGKDRPVLIIARIDANTWAGCYLSTKEHRGFVSVGSGPWDSQGRESFLSPERVLRVSAKGMRRESTGMERATFERAVAVVMRAHGLA